MVINSPNLSYGWSIGGIGDAGGGPEMPMPAVPNPIPPFPEDEEEIGTSLPSPSISGGVGASLYPNPNLEFNPPVTTTPEVNHLECPICQKMLSPPIYQCKNGHTLCNVCIERLDYCPHRDCWAPLEGLGIRNTTLEEICKEQKALTPCPNKEEGCPVVIPGGNMPDHLEVCEFFSYPFCLNYLGFKECTRRVTRFSIVSHLCEGHKVEEMKQSKFMLKLTAPSSALQPGSSSGQGFVWSPILIKHDKLEGYKVLLKCVVPHQGFMNLTGYLLSSSSDTEWKRFRIRFQIESVSKVAGLEWTGHLIFHQFNEAMKDSMEEIIDNVNSFRIPLKSLAEYVKPLHSHDETLKTSQLKIKVSVLKQASDSSSPFNNLEDENSLEKMTPLSLPASGYSFSDDEIEENVAEPKKTFVVETSLEVEYINYYSVEHLCTHCAKPLYGEVIYQCLQCPSIKEATYFCRTCIEHGNTHSEHLTMRISKPGLQPLAAVAFECASRELQL